MAASLGGDELAEDWWEMRTRGGCRKRNKVSARSSTDPIGVELPKVSASKRKRKKSKESAVVGGEVRPTTHPSRLVLDVSSKRGGG